MPCNSWHFWQYYWNSIHRTTVIIGSTANRAFAALSVLEAGCFDLRACLCGRTDFVSRSTGAANSLGQRILDPFSVSARSVSWKPSHYTMSTSHCQLVTRPTMVTPGLYPELPLPTYPSMRVSATSMAMQTPAHIIVLYECAEVRSHSPFRFVDN